MELRKFIATTTREYLNEQQNNDNNLNDIFLSWFSNSKVVDKKGNPLVVYHGTNTKFETFRTGENQYVYFTSDVNLADKYATHRSKKIKV